MRIGLALLIVVGAAGCGPEVTEESGVMARLDFRREAFYDAPFPSDDLRKDDGTVDLSRFPNPNRVQLVEQARALIVRDTRGFSTTSAIYIPLTGAIDAASLPTVEESVRTDANAFVLDVEGKELVPIRANFLEDAGPFGARNLISLLPLQGRPLRPNALHAVVLRRGIRDAGDAPLAIHPMMRALRNGQAFELPAALRSSYQEALYAIRALASTEDDIAAMAVFTTGDPAAELVGLADVAKRWGLPQPPSDLALTQTFDSFCVFRGTVEMPVYQRGEPPYLKEGGDFFIQASGRPLKQIRARLVLTIPRQKMPDSGYPIVVVNRVGLGGEQPIVDRGVHEKAGGPDVPGTGPARELAAAGFAGITVDGPVVGSRNPMGVDEQFLFFNFQNPGALRDNVRQTALELALLPELINKMSVDARACPGADTGNAQAHFYAGFIALFGHSTGAWTAPIGMAITTRYGALILSGAGGSWIENVMDKRKPLTVRPIGEALLNYPMDGLNLRDDDPALSLIQWAAESADPQVYANRILGRPPVVFQHVLSMQGIVDNYILPDIANSVSLPLGVALAGPALDDPKTPGLAGQSPLARWLSLAGRSPIALPAMGNVEIGGGRVTAVVTQHPGDGVEDAHEVVFQSEAPKRQYRCFLESWRNGGVPRVPAAGAGPGCG